MAKGYLTERLEIRCEPELKAELEELVQSDRERNMNALVRTLLREAVAHRKAQSAAQTA